MEKYYFTFGQDQRYTGYFVVIEASSSDAARKKMFDIFGSDWSSQYDKNQWVEGGKTQQQIHGYKELNLETFREQ